MKSKILKRNNNSTCSTVELRKTKLLTAIVAYKTCTKYFICELPFQTIPIQSLLFYFPETQLSPDFFKHMINSCYGQLVETCLNELKDIDWSLRTDILGWSHNYKQRWPDSNVYKIAVLTHKYTLYEIHVFVVLLVTVQIIM